MANINRTTKQWQQIFEQHTASGLQIAAFCQQQKLNTSSFYAWRKRLANNSLYSGVTDSPTPTDNSSNDWVNIMPEQTLPSQSPSQDWDIELALPNGVVLRMNKR